MTTATGSGHGALVAGVDSSTQSCKIVVCQAETGRIVRTSRAPHPAETEVSAEEWWRAFAAASAEPGLLDGVQAMAVGGGRRGGRRPAAGGGRARGPVPGGGGRGRSARRPAPAAGSRFVFPSVD